MAQANVKLQLGFMRRFDEGFLHAKEALESGDMGQIMVIKSTGRGPGLPPPWIYEVRQSLGAAQLRAGQTDAAERTFREALATHPRDGRLLFGLGQALRAQNRASEAELVLPDLGSVRFLGVSGSSLLLVGIATSAVLYWWYASTGGTL